MINIDIIDTDKNNIPQRKCQKNGMLCKFPSTTIINGKSGSGKSNLVANIFKNKQLLKDYFNYVVFMSPSSSVDDIVKALELPEENIIHNFTEKDVNNIVNSQREYIEENGLKKAIKNRKVAIILDDIISNQKFLRSDELLKALTQSRHYLISCYILTQSWTKVPRALRLNANQILYFQGSNSEMERLTEEYGIQGCSKKDFYRLIRDATDKQYSFLGINMKEPIERRFRKNLNEIIDISNYRK